VVVTFRPRFRDAARPRRWRRRAPFGRRRAEAATKLNAPPVVAAVADAHEERTATAVFDHARIELLAVVAQPNRATDRSHREVVLDRQRAAARAGAAPGRQAMLAHADPALGIGDEVGRPDHQHREPHAGPNAVQEPAPAVELDDQLDSAVVVGQHGVGAFVVGQPRVDGDVSDRGLERTPSRLVAGVAAAQDLRRGPTREPTGDHFSKLALGVRHRPERGHHDTIAAGRCDKCGGYFRAAISRTVAWRWAPQTS
jgi:hypothetical protein